MKTKEKLAFGLGAVGKDMVYMLSASYILYYYQDVLGVSAAFMGVLLLIARVFDAFNDPLMGILVAKTKTRWGKFRPWLFIGTVLDAVILYFMFAAPPSLDGKGLMAYAAVFYILWGVTYTMMDIPYWSMIPAFTKSGKERENLSALARTCAGVGSALVTIFTVMIVSVLGSLAASKSSTVATNEFSNVTLYLVELDDEGNTTGEVYETSGCTVSVSADESEFEDSLSYSASSADYTITINSSLVYSNDDTNVTFDYVMDEADGEAVLIVYLSSEDYTSAISNGVSASASLASTKDVERLGYKYFALIIAILFVVFTTITCLTIKESNNAEMKTATVGQMFKALFANDQAMTMVITIVLINIATYITSNLLIYFFKYDLAGSNWEGNYTLFNTFAGGIQILSMMLLFPFLRKFFNVIKIFYISVFSSIFGYIILLIMALSGVSTVYPFLVPGFFIMAAVGMLNVLVTIFLANTVDYGELKNGRREESVIFSMQTFVVKLASGIAALVASICLSVFKISESDNEIEAVSGSLVSGAKSLISDIKASGATVVSNDSLVGLRLVMTLLPIFGLVIAIILFKKKFILTDEKTEEIQTLLIERRGEIVRE